ncbi:MAG TPA: sigma-70 family RNA polymerase sigma factor [Gemmataceae bacterium]|jgi:RNA polymerase sigma-70 factor (ECF subfamily)|nr:sigma-70 family RNA polymerase sigma factor [Gemmataceae bacterium]
MSESLKTTELQDLVDRIRAGDRHAADALIRRSAERLEGLARKMLRDFPGVRRWEQTGDVLQNAVTRLLKTLRKVTPDSVAGFFRLAAQAVRRELLDMVRHYHGPHGLGRHHESLPDGSSGPLSWLAIPPAEVRNLERWTAFHEAVEQLPEADRELLELGYYEGLKTDEIARLLVVEEWTVRRRWNKAIRQLIVALGDEIPSL